jgi:hypothetical protein
VIYDAIIAKIADTAQVDRLITVNVAHFQRVWPAGGGLRRDSAKRSAAALTDGVWGHVMHLPNSLSTRSWCMELHRDFHFFLGSRHEPLLAWAVPKATGSLEAPSVVPFFSV